VIGLGGGRWPASRKAGAVILFGDSVLWQMPHFWALALRYRADYAAGGFPMVSERVGVEGTARLIQLYALGLTAWSLAAPPSGWWAGRSRRGRGARWPADLAGGQVSRGSRTTSGVALPLSLLQFLPPPAIPEVMVGERLIRHTLS